MKKASSIFFVILGLAFITGWEKIAGEILNIPESIQDIIVLCALAPIMEEFIFRWLPQQFSNRLIANLGKDWEFLNYTIMAIACYLFTVGHTGYYEHFGWHYALLFQGVFSLVAWYLCRKGYWYAVLFHSLANASIILFLSQNLMQ